MWLAEAPGLFAGGDAATPSDPLEDDEEEGGGFPLPDDGEAGGYRDLFGALRIHPKYLVGPAEHGVVMAWRGWRGRPALLALPGGGVIEIPGTPCLPYGGGLLDQPAALLDAFAVMDRAAACLKTSQQEE